MLEAAFQVIDPRLAPRLRAEVASVGPSPVPAHLVLAGHRSAGKSSLLPIVASALGRVAVDLDAAIEAASGRALARWVEEDEADFRRVEREVFASLDPRSVIAVGGGFLAHHADLLEGRTVVLVPISFETYCERLLRDATRPRLRPHVSIDEELRTVFTEREQVHQRIPTMPMAQLLASLAEPR